MKIAYVASRYPAVSHTFILREVLAMRARGFEICTFSVRRATRDDVLGGQAEEEAARTRWLVPVQARPYRSAVVWVLFTRTVLAVRTLLFAVLRGGVTLGERLKWAAYFAEAVQLAYWLHLDRFDRLHCHFGNAGSNTAMLAARLARIPFSLTCHGMEINEPKRYVLDEKVAFADVVVCVSKYGKSLLMMASKPEHWHKIHVVRCGVLPAEPRGANAASHVSHILCVARLSVEKGHFVLLDALSILRSRGVVFRCTLVGDGPMRAMIEARARVLDLMPLLTFTGALDPESVAELYRSVDVVVLASFSEGVPIVLMEAAAHGLPVVATRVGGVPELVQHGDTGFVVAPGDSQELGDALQQILNDPDRARLMGDRGVEVVRRQFNCDVSARMLEELFLASVRERTTRRCDSAAEKGKNGGNK